MTLTSLDILGLRGFAASQRLNLAQPSGEPGSGLTVLVGPNNGGKSTIVEAFRAFASDRAPSFAEDKRNKASGDRLMLQLEGSSTFQIRTVDPGGSETVRVPDTTWTLGLFVLPSRRVFPPYFGKSDPFTRDNYMGQWTLPAQRSQPLNEFSYRLFQIQENRSAFDELFRHVMDPAPDWYIDQSAEGNHYLKFRTGEAHHSSDGLGEGVVSLLFIVDALYDSEASETIVIDEPELSLHPSLQRSLGALFKRLSADRQIVLATHSPHFVDWDAIENGGKLVRVTRDSSGSHLFELSGETAQRIGGLRADVNNPHVLGLDAKEVFFLQDGIILVEGQEDVLAYEAMSSQLGIPLTGRLFGWGVGGASKMTTVTAILADLGYKEIVGVLDSDKAAVVETLRLEFPGFRFLVSPTEDIRSKDPVRPRPAKEGLVDRSLRLTSERTESARELLNALVGALDELRGSRGASAT